MIRQEIHACDGVALPFETVCTVLDGNRHEILEHASRTFLEESSADEAALAPTRVVTAALERKGDRSATLAAHWIQPDPAVEAEGGLSAWLHCHLMLLPRQAGDRPVTEVLLTARSETPPRDPDKFNDDLCARLLRQMVTEIERKAAAESLPG